MVAEGFVPEAGILSINHENRKEDERCDFSYIALKFDSAGQGPDGIVPGTEVPDGDACIPKGDAQKKKVLFNTFDYDFEFIFESCKSFKIIYIWLFTQS